MNLNDSDCFEELNSNTTTNTASNFFQSNQKLDEIIKQEIGKRDLKINQYINNIYLNVQRSNNSEHYSIDTDIKFGYNKQLEA